MSDQPGPVRLHRGGILVEPMGQGTKYPLCGQLAAHGRAAAVTPAAPRRAGGR